MSAAQTPSPQLRAPEAPSACTLSAVAMQHTALPTGVFPCTEKSVVVLPLLRPGESAEFLKRKKVYTVPARLAHPSPKARAQMAAAAIGGGKRRIALETPIARVSGPRTRERSCLSRSRAAARVRSETSGNVFPRSLHRSAT